MNTLTTIKEFCLSNTSPKQLFGIHDQPDYAKLGSEKIFKAFLAIAILLQCFLIICLSGKLYFRYSQEPICRESPESIEPYILLYNSTFYGILGLVVSVVLFVQFDVLQPLHCITYICKQNSLRKFIFKICQMSIAIFLLSNFIAYLLSSKHVFLYKTQQYSYCNYLVSRGKISQNYMPLNKIFIKSEAVKEIEQFMRNQIFPTQMKAVNFFSGSSGVGKSTAIKYFISEMQEKKNQTQKEKQILIYYNNFQTNYYNFYLGKKLFSQLIGTPEQEQLFKISNQLRYLSERAKVVAIFDGVNRFKLNQKFLKYLRLFAELSINIALDFHLFLCSSQQGLQTQYDENYSFLRQNATFLKIVPQQNSKQLKIFFDKKLNLSTLSAEYKKKISEKQQQIINLCYGFGQLNKLFKIIAQKIVKLSIDQIIAQRKISVYKAAVKKMNKNKKFYKKEICAVLNDDQITELKKQNLKELQQKNILFSQNQFYSKIIQVSFRENYHYCQQKQNKNLQKKIKGKIKIKSKEIKDK